MVDEIMLDESQVPTIIVEEPSAPQSDYPVLEALNKVIELLTQIRDGLGVTTEAVIAQDIKPTGVLLGGTNGANENAGESDRVVGQGIPSGVSVGVHSS